ncbi:uncharacterized protein PHALS_00066 [Plasmopara halstedii]|uniref:Deleted in lung and esophageal cancer protein 1 Ig-like domain-containing protein n=1 Tax=Plasmopara halstedii TaxID=4781 RepID=A0A0N7L3F5_PLAHL|nr:uncharacterized protein PHALS_00066 [Plasmopara halstedii]CEG35731.1 hypothetical protein PHALS_00066 [Plasmopara halstedii]|eukprot:XP_024572100.1 hypothetical protein PHALS_00066 [Plasmopara halstedii]
MTGASKSKAASTSDYEIDQTAKTLDLDAVADDIALQMHHEECERLEKFQEQNEPNHVAVGATAHVIRRAFHTFYDKPEIRDQAIQVLSESESARLISDTSEAQREVQQTGNNDDLNEQEVKEESPFVAQAQARKQAIALKFERKHERANSLLQFMELRQQEAAEADAQFAQNLSDQGLVLKAQIPIGPTNLRLNDHELQLAQDKGSDFGEFVESLLYAKTFMVEYEEKRQHLSGNQEKLVKRTGKESQKEEYMGYLNTTTSFNIRTEATLEHHKHDIADIKAAHAVQRATAASAHLLKANIHGQLQSMNPVEKRKNRAILKRMQSKLNFVRNPRYSIQDVSKMTRHNLAKGNEKNPPCFAVAPKPPILFSTYDIGGMYEQIVYVRNVSVLSRCARILSPSTMFFTLTSIKFPTDRNQVAPGMHIEVCIRFTPNSRADFTDSFSVQYETMQSETQGSSNSSTMIVPLVASRESPELTLPLVIQAQNTLVGGRSVKSLKCKNLGGKAKFWILTEFAYSQLHHRELENSTVDTVVKMLENGNMLDATMKIGPFSLQPTAFELAKGQSVILELIYIPSESHEQRENFVMVCDNCLVKVFELVGRGCQVEVVATKINHVQIDTSIPNMGLLDRMVFKDEVIVNASAQQSLEIMNKTPLDVKYFWHIHSLYNENKDQTNVVSHESKWMPPFCINPKTGVFEMLSTNKFTIGFSPTEACTYACQAILMINDISACSISKSNLIDHLDSTATEVENAMPVFSIQLHGRGKHGSFTIIPAFINSWTLFRDKSPDSGSQSVHILNSKQNYLSTVQLINQCNARIAFCWDITQTRQRHLTMHDSSLSTLVQNEEIPPFELAIRPLTGEIEPLGHQSIEVTFTPFCTGSFSLSVPCQLVSRIDNCNLQSPRCERWLLLEGRVAGAEIEILTREIDFGPVLVGTGAESVITIRNPSRTVTTDWKFVQLGLTPENESGINHLTQSSPGPKLRRSNSKDSVISRRSSTSFVSGNDTERSLFTSRTSQPRAIVTFAPDAGVLAPGELFTLKAICMAGSFPERFRGLFRCQTAPERTFTGNKISHAAVSSRAEVQCAEVFLSTSHLTLGIIYLGVEIHRSFELVNASNLETAFKFVEPEGTSRAYTVSFVPKEGIIHSKARLAVTLHYTPRQTGRFSVIFACSVRGMSGPLGLEVSSSHKGLVLSYSLVQAPLPSDYRAKESTSAIKLPESPKEIALKRKISLSDCDLEPQVNSVPKLAFGDCVPLGEKRVLNLLIQNYSGIEALLTLEAKRFPAAATSSTLVLKNNENLNRAQQTSFKNDKLELPFIPSKTYANSRLSNAKENEYCYQSSSGRKYLRQRVEEDEARQILRDNRGVAFDISPSSVSIPPWEQQVVQILCFNNMPGTYVDDIICRATGALPIILHTHVNVVGSPLTFKRNCVGLYFNKPLIEDNPVNSRPTLKFGAVCVRSNAITKTLSVINRGPQQARLVWKLVESGSEDQEVRVTLRVDFASKLHLQITPCDHDSQAILPFTIEPKTAMVPAFSLVPFRITFQPPSNTLGPSRIVLLADAHWYDPKNEDTKHSDTNIKSNATLSDVASSENSQLDASSINLKHQSNNRRATAVGKAFAVVRMANALGRKSGPVMGRAPGSSLSIKCLSVLLSADTIEPELFIDKPRDQAHALNSQALDAHNAKTSSSIPTINPMLHPYHIKFTTWSTLLSVSKAHPSHLRQIVLLNRLGTKVTFRLESEGPFAVTNAVSLAPRHPLSSKNLSAAHRRPSTMSESHIFLLPPQMSVHIDLRFLPANFQTSHLPNFQCNSLQSLHNQIDGELRVLFSTQSIQTIRLTAVVLRPAIVVSPSIINFGQVTTSRSIVLRLANPTVVPAHFSIQHIPRPKSITRVQQEEMRRYDAHLIDKPEVFTFSQLTGVLVGPTPVLKSDEGYLDISDSMRVRLRKDTRFCHPFLHAPLDLSVDFHPQKDQQYQSRFRFKVENGRDFEIVLKGTG